MISSSCCINFLVIVGSARKLSFLHSNLWAVAVQIWAVVSSSPHWVSHLPGLQGSARVVVDSRLVPPV